MSMADVSSGGIIAFEALLMIFVKSHYGATWICSTRCGRFQSRT